MIKKILLIFFVFQGAVAGELPFIFKKSGEIDPPVAYKLTPHFTHQITRKGSILSFNIETDFPERTVYRATLVREIQDSGTIHSVRENNAGYFLPLAEAPAKDPLTLGKTPLGIVKEKRIAGKFEIFSKDIQTAAFGYDPKKMTVDTDHVLVEIEIDPDFPAQTKQVDWKGHLFLKYTYSVPLPLP